MNNKEVKSMVRGLAKAVIEELKSNDAEMNKLKENRGIYSENYFSQLQNEIRVKREDIVNNTRNKTADALDEYRDSIEKAYKLNGEDITPDAKLFNTGLKLTTEQLNDLSERYADNMTMSQLIENYAKENEISYQTRTKSKADALQLADALDNYMESVTDRPEYADIWTSDEYFEEAFSEE